MDQTRFLTLRQLASRWSISVGTLRNWLCYRPDYLPFATKLGNAWRFPIDEVEAHERANRISPLHEET